MPRIVAVPDGLRALILGQDGILHRQQALEFGLTIGAITSRLRDGHWRRLLPEVYLTNSGEPTYRQSLVSALVYAGPGTAIDAANACRFHRVESVPVPMHRIYVVAPYGSTARSHGPVVVRRTVAPIAVQHTEYVRYVEPATAVIAATRRMRSERQVLATLSEVLQRRIVEYDDLVRAHIQGPPRNALLADAALEQLGTGVRSASEADFRKLAIASSILPELEYNVWLKLPSGQVVCLDALAESSAVVHETNGRKYHSREDLFMDMQERHDVLTTTGFAVLHNAPVRIQRRGREVITQFERCHVMYDGRGMPPGVVRLPEPPTFAIAD